MKFLFCVAALALAAIANVEATAESNAHVRAHDYYAPPKVPEWGTCKTCCGEQKQCVPGTVCRILNNCYGQCIRNPAPKWGQCGGKTPWGTWKASCKGNAECTKLNQWYWQCQ
uniref:CBM1 domain-containing protein n=1 Tax=Globisporangium ultimum (strain ATCC 200006 / CBS 805.95 / DAOM BR144) TaxID=431595 RepID=K3WDX9_GLOUD